MAYERNLILGAYNGENFSLASLAIGEEKMAGTTLVEREETDETESEDHSPLAKKSPLMRCL